jgi:hypothetical protein
MLPPANLHDPNALRHPCALISRPACHISYSPSNTYATDPPFIGGSKLADRSRSHL